MNKPEEVANGEIAPPPTSTMNQSIDIEKLAEKVYQRMRADARLQQSRGARRSTRR